MVRMMWLAMAVILCPVAQAQQAPGWDEARKAILESYARHQPDAKVLELSGPEKRDAILVAVRYYGSALVERADKTRSRDRVRAEFRLVGDRWELHSAGVYDSVALADVEPPSAAEAQRLFDAAWPKDKCEGFDITQVAIDGEPRFQRELIADRTKAKRWFVYSLKIAARGNGKFRMSEDGAAYLNATQNMLLWNPGERSWSVDPRHLRCTGFVKQK